MAKKAILYVAKTSKGGSAFSLYHLVNGLNRSQYEPVIAFYTEQQSQVENKLRQRGIHAIVLRPDKALPNRGTANGSSKSEPPPASPAAGSRDIGLWLDTHVGKLAGEGYRSFKAVYRFLREAHKIIPLVRTIRANDIDLVHVNNGLRNSKPGIVAAWLTGRPCLCHVRMFDPLTRFDRLFARAVNVFVYISNAVASGYAQQGISPTKGVIVHNAVDLEDFSRAVASVDRQSVRSEFGWTTEQRLVGVIGRLDWWKGHEYFLQAIARVMGRVPNLKALIVGEAQDSPLNGAYYDRLRSLTHSLNLEDKVVFTGFRSDIPRLMSAMEIVVLSSATPEPFGRVVIEAMAASTPVVATAAGGVLDIVEDGVNGLLVPCRDAAAMAQAIADLLLDPDKADRMGRAARRRVEAVFSIDKHVDAIQTLYDSILGAGHPSRAPHLQAATPNCQASGGQS